MAGLDLKDLENISEEEKKRTKYKNVTQGCSKES
jgi:hypothetical protein